MGTKHLPLKKLKKISGIKQSKKGRYSLEVETPERVDLSDAQTREREIHRILGNKSEDGPLAKRLTTMEGYMQDASLPELVTYDWLKANNTNFSFQTREGGRGIIPDFVIYQGNVGAAWLVQGEYYHSREFQESKGQVGRDMAALLQLKGKYFNGVRITNIVELWESDIYNDRPAIFEFAMAGISLRV